MDRDIEIVRWVVRVKDAGPRGERAKLVGMDAEGNEYEFRYSSEPFGGLSHLEIIVTEKEKENG